MQYNTRLTKALVFVNSSLSSTMPTREDKEEKSMLIPTSELTLSQNQRVI